MAGNPEWASTLLVYCNDEEWEQDDEGQSYVIDKRVFASYNPEERKLEKQFWRLKISDWKISLATICIGDFTFMTQAARLLRGTRKIVEFSSFMMMLHGSPMV